MNSICNKHIQNALNISKELIILADEGERDSVDDGCILLFSIVRDCAYKIKAEALREKDTHQSENKWENQVINNK